MTNLTDQQLNEEIALKRGWTYNNGVLYNPGNSVWHEGIPDFCNSWEWAGRLLEEILNKEGSIEILHDTFLVHGYHVAYRLNEDGDVADTPTRAIAEAWNEVNL
jgi:hypothetical protein